MSCNKKTIVNVIQNVHLQVFGLIYIFVSFILCVSFNIEIVLLMRAWSLGVIFDKDISFHARVKHL